MSTPSKPNAAHRGVQVALAALALFALGAAAEPMLALKTGEPCATCHVNPLGGGARTAFGAYYGSQELPALKGDTDAVDPGRLSDSIRLGGDLRFDYDQRDSDAGDSQSFDTQSAQLYLTVQPKGGRVLFYLDQQVAPGAALSREAFVMLPLGRHYLKAGKMILPYGLRLEDDNALVRQASGINFDNSDNGVELGLTFGRSGLNVALSNGTGATSNDDERFQYIARYEYRGAGWRAGGSALLNQAEAGERTMANLFGGFNWRGVLVLAEVGRIEDELPASDANRDQNVALLEVNKAIAAGLNLKLTGEYLDPDRDLAGNLRRRQSLLLEYTPFANLQVRGGLRRLVDEQLGDSDESLEAFAQLHLYY